MHQHPVRAAGPFGRVGGGLPRTPDGLDLQQLPCMRCLEVHMNWDRHDLIHFENLRQLSLPAKHDQDNSTRGAYS